MILNEDLNKNFNLNSNQRLVIKTNQDLSLFNSTNVLYGEVYSKELDNGFSDLNDANNITLDLWNNYKKIDLATVNTLNYYSYNENSSDDIIMIIKTYIKFPESGEYIFAIDGDDSVDMYIPALNFSVGYYDLHAKCDCTDYRAKITVTDDMLNKYYLCIIRNQEHLEYQYLALYDQKPSETSLSITNISDYFYNFNDLSNFDLIKNFNTNTIISEPKIINFLDKLNYKKFVYTGPLNFNFTFNKNIDLEYIVTETV